jgi:hypothetical protein
VLADALHVDVLVHFCSEARHVEPQPLGMGVQIPERKMLLIGEQQVVHLPELALLAGALGGLGGRERVGVGLLEREVAEDDAYAAREALEQQPHGRRGLLAGRALEIAVFDYHDRRVLDPEGVIGGVDRYGQIRALKGGLGHGHLWRIAF